MKFINNILSCPLNVCNKFYDPHYHSHCIFRLVLLQVQAIVVFMTVPLCGTWTSQRDVFIVSVFYFSIYVPFNQREPLSVEKLQGAGVWKSSRPRGEPQTI